ncbi:MAG: UPF0164 family protein [candidate division Zixibacteria bacterium]|nr:UPF0164 family protein [candidate division Zixibacteria bacterium]
MKYLKTKIVVLILLMMIPADVRTEEKGGYAGSFLDWGAGSRAIALGKTFTAIADDGTAIYWNPAGLNNIKSKQITAMHAVVFEDRKVNYVSFTYPANKLTLSASWLRFGVNDLQERSSSGQLTGHFSDSENAFVVGAGYPILLRLNMNLSIGASLKYFYHSLYDRHANGIGFDLGSLVTYKPEGLFHNICLGFVVQNLGAKLKWNTESNHTDRIPVSLRLGSVVQLNAIPLKYALDIDKKEERDIRIHTGMEYEWNILAIRVGINDDEFTAGTGFKLNVDTFSMQLDYAYTNDDITTKSLHFFSINLEF